MTQKSLTQPEMLAGMVQYQDGSVVSKTVIGKKTGTVTLFAFAAGQGLSEHTAPFDALVMIIDGAAEITLGGAPHHLSAGEALILPANIPHALHAADAFKMMLVMIKSDW